MDPVVLAHQATDILVPALPFIYAERNVVAAKVHDMVLEKGIEKLGSKANKVKNLYAKLRSKGSEPIETALEELSKNPENQKAKEELQQEISRLLKEAPGLAKEIEHIIININAEKIDQLTILNGHSSSDIKNFFGDINIQFFKNSDDIAKETVNQSNLMHYNPLTLSEYSDRLKSICPDLEIYPNSWIDQDVFRPVIGTERIFGRENELEDLQNLLKDKSSLVITGFRGTGKSTLASLFVDKMYKNGKFAGIYWRKVDETTDITDIIDGFFTAIGKSVIGLTDYKIPEQINILFRELNESSYLLVLDNFESLLDSQTNKPLKSKVGFSELIESAAVNRIRSKIMFTSWVSPASERGISPFSYQIKGLDASAGILLLRHQGLLKESEAELKEAVNLSGGHPLALILLVQLVIQGAGKLSDFLKEDSLWIGEGGEVAENILNKVYTERLSEDERQLLQYVSIFRQPVPAKAIIKIANDPFWTGLRVKRIAWKLCIKSLLQKSDDSYWEESLISKYVTSLLSKKPEPHKLAMNYYLSLSIPENPVKKEDVQSLIEAHYHACMAVEYDQAFDIIFANNLDDTLISGAIIHY